MTPKGREKEEEEKRVKRDEKKLNYKKEQTKVEHSTYGMKRDQS